MAVIKLKQPLQNEMVSFSNLVIDMRPFFKLKIQNSDSLQAICERMMRSGRQSH